MSTKHNLIQERLNLKRAPLDEWNTHEQLCLASAVACSGDQNWMSVSRALKGIVSNYNARPNDWFVSKSCATQYGKLLESVDTPKRKKRTASERDQPERETPSTPVESLVKKLTNERVLELKKAIADEQKEYAKLKEEIQFLQSNSMDETRIREMWNEIEQEKIQKERQQVHHDQWLKEREAKKIELERIWRPNYGLNKSPSVLKAQKSTTEETEPDTTQQPGTSSTSPSPLLTSLLKSSQANQTPLQPSNTARSAPTITNLLTGSSLTSSSNSPTLITQSSTNAHNNLINASVSVPMVQNATINHSASSVQIPVSQSAPTLITLLDKKPTVASTSMDLSSEKQQLMMSISEGSGGKDGADGKDEEADILADFNELIAEKFDEEDLADIDSIIMNPEILDEKITEDEPLKDVDDSSQATSTDDYDKLKIKQLVEDLALAGVPEVGQPVKLNEDITMGQAVVATTSSEDIEMIQNPSEPDNSCSASIEMVEPNESNDSKDESTAVEEKVMIISDESSNTNDEKKDQLSDKLETGEGEESQSVKSSVDETKDASGDDSKEKRAFQGIQGSEENSASSEKETKGPPPVYQVDDSDEDGTFEDAKETHDDSTKHEKASDADLKPTEKTSEVQEVKTTTTKAGETEEVTRSAGSVDSDDEVLEVKVSRSTGRKKAIESLKTDTPSSSTRSRDHSENDDNRDTTPIKTRSRHSSLVPNSDPKGGPPSFTKEQDHSFWKNRWEDCQKEIQKHKDYSSIIDSKAIYDESYKRVVLCPMNMKMIHKNIENHISTMPGEVKRDFLLMCNNITMINKKGSRFNETINHFMKDGLKIIDTHMDVDDMYKTYRKQIKKKN